MFFLSSGSARVGEELHQRVFKEVSIKSCLFISFFFFLELRLGWKDSRCGWGWDYVKNWVTDGKLWRTRTCQRDWDQVEWQRLEGWRQGCCENTHTLEAFSYYGDVQHRIHHWGNESCPHSKALTQNGLHLSGWGREKSCNIWGRISLGRRVNGHVMENVKWYTHEQAVLWWNRQLERWNSANFSVFGFGAPMLFCMAFLNII